MAISFGIIIIRVKVAVAHSIFGALNGLPGAEYYPATLVLMRGNVCCVLCAVMCAI